MVFAPVDRRLSSPKSVNMVDVLRLALSLCAASASFLASASDGALGRGAKDGADGLVGMTGQIKEIEQQKMVMVKGDLWPVDSADGI